MRLSDARESIRYATLLQKRHYDANHSAIPAYKIGDYVTLRLDRHPTSLRHNKLS